jgi:hypothetical protein
MITTDYMKDREQRLAFLYRVEVSWNYLFQPMQQATGVSQSTFLARFDD